MSLPQIPSSITDWDLAKLDALLTIPGVEGEIFDFKGQGASANNKVPDLKKDICAMANVSGGTFVLGIDPVKDSKGDTVGYTKNGYNKGTEDRIGLAISQQVNEIDPIPKFETGTITEGTKYYPVLKIYAEELKKAYFIRGTGQCFVRIGSSSQPATRSTIINLLSGSREKVRDVDRLRATCVALKNDYIMVSQVIRAGNHVSSAIIPPVDLVFIKNATIQAEWFLVERGLLGEVFGNGYQAGLYTHVHSLERMNAYIDGFNRTLSPSEKKSFLDQLESWRENGSSYQATAPFLEQVIKACEQFLKEKT